MSACLYDLNLIHQESLEVVEEVGVQEVLGRLPERSGIRVPQ